MSVLYYLLGKSDILLVRQSRTVNHYRREAQVNAALAELEAVSVVEVENNLRMLAAQFLGILYSTFCHVTEQSLVSIVTGTLRNLKDNR